MLIKLSLRNAKRQVREYSIYFATIIISIAMLYSFNNFIFSNTFQELSKAFSDSGDNGSTYIVVFYSCVIVLVVGWLISYMLNFMLRKRSFEFSTYILLGIEKKEITKIYVFENGIIGILSLIVGIIVGYLLSNTIYHVISLFFNNNMQFQYNFSFKAASLTIIYFLIIYIILLVSSNIKFKKLKLITLMNYDRFNEIPTLRNTNIGILVFIVSIFCGIGSLLFFILQPIDGNYTNIMIGFLLIFLCHFGLCFGICPLYYHFYSKNGSWKTKSGNTFLFRLFSAKINKFTFLWGTVASILTVALLLISTGISYSVAVNKLLELNVFDVAIFHNGEKNELFQYDQYLKEYTNLTESHSYNLYTNNDTTFMSIRNKALKSHLQQRNLDIDPNDYVYDFNKYDIYMSYSDYNILRESLGYEPLKMESNEFMIHCLTYLQDSFTKSLNNTTLKLSETILSFAGVVTDNFSQYDGYGNGQELIIIIPDKYVNDLQISYSLFVANLSPTEDTSFLNTFISHFSNLQLMNLNLVEGNSDYMSKLSYGTTSDYLAGKYVILSTKAEITLILSLIFLGLLLCIACTVILAVQLLSDNIINSNRYSILHLLGMDKQSIKTILKKQIIIYFSLPALPTIFLSVGLIYVIVNTVIEEYFLVPIFTNLTSIVNIVFVATISIFILIYIIYIFISYMIVKKDILQNMK